MSKDSLVRNIYVVMHTNLIFQLHNYVMTDLSVYRLPATCVHLLYIYVVKSISDCAYFTRKVWITYVATYITQLRMYVSLSNHIITSPPSEKDRHACAYVCQ